MKEKNKNIFIHSTSQVENKDIGEGTKIWQFSVILEGCHIGKNCNINFSCFIEQGVILGDNVTVKSGIYLWEGIECEDDVFLGPNVVFTNDIYPRSKNYKEPIKTLIKQGASIGANSTILAGVKVGKYAMTGIASVVTRDIPDYALYYGNPAKFKCWIDEYGNKLEKISPDKFVSSTSGKKYVLKKGILSQVKNNN
jgi:acetyltransferase-like isoleucine patch superfamily enzyme